MFTLTHIIAHFNHCYNKKISPHKTWRLVYLQPDALTFLDCVDDLIRRSSDYSSHFIRPRQFIHKQLKAIKNKSSPDVFATLHLINKKLAKDQQLELRWNWEKK